MLKISDLNDYVVVYFSFLLEVLEYEIEDGLNVMFSYVDKLSEEEIMVVVIYVE